MAKKINKETNEVSNNKTKLEVTNCDLKSIDSIRIESFIRIIRGQQVILDSDLAMLYECINGTKDINKAVNLLKNSFMVCQAFFVILLLFF